MTQPVRSQIVVNASAERAFTVFTTQFGDFKPREHNLLGSPIVETVFEPRVGGHIYDVGADGWRSVADGVGGEGGWPLYVRRFAELVDR
ncbi:hypothetical protein [Mycobacterium sp. NAZ190054]|uniref:hypothetical protein n=1 Tax=Mycobacterium sp. NAZ190054 TaxID=1747766 RepID=UPI0007962270|nr:hypothetical protein [Mycobacterium sp. NAZ190054]KWX68727.1 hypothetical protein ASJ79_16485 [Mycobacterium sp. NAZ190054]